MKSPKRRASQMPKFLRTSQALPGAARRCQAYALHLVQNTQRSSRRAAALLEWASEYGTNLGIEVIDDEEDFPAVRRRRGREPSPAAWRRLVATLEKQGGEGGEPSTLVARLGELCQLDRLELVLLQFCLDYMTDRRVENLWDKISDAQHGPQQLVANVDLLALVLDCTRDEIRSRLGTKGALRHSGLVSMGQYGVIECLERLVKAVRDPGGEELDPLAVLFGPPAHTGLSVDDYQHLGSDVPRLTAMLRGALARREKGVVVLLYGEPGTGKTELAKAIAASLDVPLRAVAEAEQDGSEPGRAQRLQELCLAQRLSASAGPSLLLFDEAEDLFPSNTLLFGDLLSGASKAFIHRVLEEGPTPVILTANDISSFGPAVLRRMSACIEVRVPPPTARARIWEKAAKEAGISTLPQELVRLAGQLPAAPALAQSAMRAASLAGGDLDTVRWAITGVMSAMQGGKRLAATDTGHTFSAEFLSADVDLSALADTLSRRDAPRRVSLLLSGPPGAGKSAYARHLAERMGLPVLQRRASDLLDKYVGQTERNIAQAFREAADGNSFLVFDEADTLLGDRAQARHGFEISMTNEMLTWLENHPLPVCATTNRIDGLDEAALRRFFIKASFRFMRPDQVAVAFRRFFELAPPEGVERLDQLTPADFDVVKRAAVLHGTLGDAPALLKALQREQTAKARGHQIKEPIGFRLVS